MRLPRFSYARLPLLALPLYLAASALQTSCSGNASNRAAGDDYGDDAAPGDDVNAGDDDAMPADAGGCAPNETPESAGGTQLCCAPSVDGAGGGSYQCHRRGTAEAPLLDGACTTQGATAAVDEIDLQTDVCVAESCAGDRTCQEFAAVVEELQGTLVCTSTHGLHWQWQGAPSDHRVERACLPVGEQTCVDGQPGGEYAYSEPYAPAYSSEPDYACGYEYGGYYGLPHVTVRQLFVLQSTCASDGGAPAPCPAGSL